MLALSQFSSRIGCSIRCSLGRPLVRQSVHRPAATSQRPLSNAEKHLSASSQHRRVFSSQGRGRIFLQQVGIHVCAQTLVTSCQAVMSPELKFTHLQGGDTNSSNTTGVHRVKMGLHKIEADTQQQQSRPSGLLASSKVPVCKASRTGHPGHRRGAQGMPARRQTAGELAPASTAACGHLRSRTNRGIHGAPMLSCTAVLRNAYCITLCCPGMRQCSGPQVLN